jgi:hypothetical protein
MQGSLSPRTSPLPGPPRPRCHRDQRSHRSPRCSVRSAGAGERGGMVGFLPRSTRGPSVRTARWRRPMRTLRSRLFDTASARPASSSTARAARQKSRRAMSACVGRACSGKYSDLVGKVSGIANCHDRRRGGKLGPLPPERPASRRSSGHGPNPWRPPKAAARRFPGLPAVPQHHPSWRRVTHATLRYACGDAAHVPLHLCMHRRARSSPPSPGAPARTPGRAA